MTAEQLLRQAASVLVVDWPSREVPNSLARAGLAVTVRNGPGPADFSVYEMDGADVAVRAAGAAPTHVDLVYVHRPVGELPALIVTAQALGARAIWRQSGLTADQAKDAAGCWVGEDESRSARALVEGAGLIYIERPYIVDALQSRVDPGV